MKNYMKENLKRMFSDSILTDVTIEIESQTIHCHKVILSSGSDFFQAMFSCDLKENNESIVNLRDSGLTYESIAYCIKYIYSLGELILPDIAMDDYIELYHAADFLQIIPLKINLLEMNIQNVLSIWKIADHFDLYDELDAASKFVCHNAEKILKSQDFLCLSESDLIKLLSDPELFISREIILLEALSNWILKCKDLPNINNLLELVRLDLVTQTDMENISKFTPSHLFDHFYEQWKRAINSGSRSTLRKGMKQRIYCLGGEKTTQFNYEHSITDEFHILFGEWDNVQDNGEKGVTLSQSPDASQPPYPTFDNYDTAGIPHDSLNMMFGMMQFNRMKKDESIHPLPSMSQCRVSHTVIFSDYSVYVIGGEDKDGILLSSVECFDLIKNEWKQLPDLDSPRCHLGGISLLDSSIWLFGGYALQTTSSVNPSNDVIIWDRQKQQWSRVITDSGVVLEMPEPLACMSVVENGNMIYILGGVDLYDSPVDSVYSLNTINYEWKRLARLPITLASFGCCIYKKSIYALTGQTDHHHRKTLNNEIFVYSIDTNCWTRFAKIIPNIDLRLSSSVILIDDCIYIIGGSNFNKWDYNVQILDLNKMVWKNSCKNPIQRAKACYFVAPDFTFS